jgi:hypothetical protein
MEETLTEAKAVILFHQKVVEEAEVVVEVVIEK